MRPSAGKDRESSRARPRVKTLPVGLFGVFRMMALVCRAKRRREFRRIETSNPAACSFTNRGVAPERIASGP